jgi:hypothetical protein
MGLFPGRCSGGPISSLRNSERRGAHKWTEEEDLLKVVYGPHFRRSPVG